NNEDGTTNQQVLTSDSYKIRHFDDMVKLVYQQGKNDQLEASAKESANLTDPEKIEGVPKGGKYGLVGAGGKKRYQV
ncbi:hypothetical protein LCGC14_2939610, partial [marine sediment metagenome]